MAPSREIAVDCFVFDRIISPVIRFPVQIFLGQDSLSDIDEI